MPSKLIVLLLLVPSLSLRLPGAAQTRSKDATPPPSILASTPEEKRTAAVFESARRHGPLALEVFLARMPKGADLHMHLSGAIYAETFIADAAKDHLCIDMTRFAFVKPDDLSHPVCKPENLPASAAFTDQKLYDALVDSFSMRSFVATPGVSGHDQFFATFDRFGGTSKDHQGEWLDEVATRAAAQNEQYLEVMLTPAFTRARNIGLKIGWPTPLRSATTALPETADDISGTTPAELAALRDKLFAAGLREEVALDREEIDSALAERKRLEHCETPQAMPACTVEIKVIYQILRAFVPQQVFAQTVLGFEVASADPDVVGINFVQPEDAYLAMSEYNRQMHMLDYLHTAYPKVHISLHAGELAPGLVPPAGLAFHIREAVEVGHAERIGHGVDVLYERDPKALLDELSRKHVMVEINLTSNDGILGVKAPNHPLPEYRAAYVPVSLNTDDEGVSRIDLTHEYTRAALEFGMGYLDLKQMARTGLEHTFLPGESLWAKPDDFSRTVPSCAHQPLGGDPSAACASFLKTSPHAHQQWGLESRFRSFEQAR
jgi:adenosine deaminase